MRILITGVTGQDGSYLAEDLSRDHDNQVWGMVRGEDNPKYEWLQGLAPRVKLVRGDLLDQTSLIDLMAEIEPEVIYNLGAYSMPSMGWLQPELMSQVTGLGVMRLLRAAQVCVPDARIMQACSLAIHGIYGAAKAYGQLVATDFRKQGMAVTNVILGGHNSPRRSPSFFAQKVVKGAVGIYRQEQDQLVLGPLERRQDWGWATDFVAQFPRVMDLPPSDYVMSTNDPHSCREWVQVVFEALNLDWMDHVAYSMDLKQPTDVPSLSAVSSPELDWTPNADFKGLAKVMVQAEMERWD